MKDIFGKLAISRDEVTLIKCRNSTITIQAQSPI